MKRRLYLFTNWLAEVRHQAMELVAEEGPVSEKDKKSIHEIFSDKNMREYFIASYTPDDALLSHLINKLKI